MLFHTNNHGFLNVEQITTDADVKVRTGTNNIVEHIEEISAGDFVMLINWYKYIKDNDIQKPDTPLKSVTDTTIIQLSIL